MTEGSAPSLAREICAPTEFVGTSTYRLARLARARGMRVDELTRRGRARLPGRWALISGDPERRGLLLCFLRAPGRDVAWLAAMGHSYEYIAYELGLPLATVAGRLRRAMRKLRVGSRRELL
ncbi:MAG TPA: LuxR C-terminal-related transcriptional regulator [Polyangiaceae bacterium]|nr:LuxR C-terminal-related transcriptional regulator [Polyangiaceae bacterium]